MKAFKAAAAALVMMVSSAPAMAASFDYNFSLETTGGDSYVGSGIFDADSSGTSGDQTTWLITGASGTLDMNPGTADTMRYTITGAPTIAGSQYFVFDQSGLLSADFSLNTTGQPIAVTGSISNGFFGAYGPETFGSATLSITARATDPVNGAVPEPATWGMMLVGFGAAGAALRRRRSADRLAAA